MPAYLKKPRQYIQLIHIAKAQLGLDDDLYRSVLLSLTNKSSCSDMGAIELDKVLEYMKSKGFKPSSKKSRKGHSPVSRNKKASEKTPLDKLRQVWIEMAYNGLLKDGSEQALLNWSKSQAKRFNKGVPVERMEWLDGDVVHFLIEQLKKWYKRLDPQLYEVNYG